jgi:SPP1 gp7 family putative phage head morphogenesis protein
MLAIPHDQATALIAGKPEVTRAVWDQLHPDLQARAYTITGIECLDTIANVRRLTASLPSGGDFDDLKDEIFDQISPFLIDPNASEEDQLKQTRAANRRAEMLLRLHGWTAYAQTQHALAEAHSDVFPFRQYLSSEDSRVRPAHAALNKKILPADHPFWLNHTPPWEFNCRCDMVVMTKDDVDAISASETKLPDEDKKVLPQSQLNQIATQQRIVKPGGQGFLDIRTPREKGGGKGYEFRPADNNLPLEQILERFAPSEKSLFQSWAATIRLSDGRTLADYWSLNKKTKPPVRKKAKPTARNAATIRTRLETEIKADHEKALAKIVEKKALAAKARTDYWKAQNDTIDLQKQIYEAAITDIVKAEVELEHIIERARTIIEIPESERGSVRFIPTKGLVKKPNILEGKRLTERYTHKDLLPEIDIVSHKGRAHYMPSTKAIHVSSSTDYDVVMHEITHGTEIQTPEVLAASRAYLLKRADGKKTVKLSVVTGYNYKANEVTYEDEWATKGGSPYIGKDYGNAATEILTMGIQRLHRDPYLFASQDPDYFDFVTTTLQKLPTDTTP